MYFEKSHETKFSIEHHYQPCEGNDRLFLLNEII